MAQRMIQLTRNASRNNTDGATLKAEKHTNSTTEHIVKYDVVGKVQTKLQRNAKGNAYMNTINVVKTRKATLKGTRKVSPKGILT